jgi:hypothetical protein
VDEVVILLVSNGIQLLSFVEKANTKTPLVGASRFAGRDTFSTINYSKKAFCKTLSYEIKKTIHHFITPFSLSRKRPIHSMEAHYPTIKTLVEVVVDG